MGKAKGATYGFVGEEGVATTLAPSGGVQACSGPSNRGARPISDPITVTGYLLFPGDDASTLLPVLSCPVLHARRALVGV